jgi:acetyl/propionyl-CoA carboxylase alpha subunit
VPGTKGLVESAEEAAQESERLGFPVMLKGMSSFNILDVYRIIG